MHYVLYWENFEQNNIFFGKILSLWSHIFYPHCGEKFMMEQGFVIREVIIQYGTMAEKERKRYKLHRNTNLKELKDRLVNELGSH